jgi:phytoene synthase
MLANGSRTFFAASFLLPRRVRDPATALYAFCRLADDAIDIGSGSERVLDELRERLDRIYANAPCACPADRAFAEVVERYGIPRAMPEALLEGFAWDHVRRRYETLSDVTAYAVRVAGSVGTMMAVVMGARSEEALARASDLGVAMQLTNIARDVGEDARVNRLYLPASWLREAGVDPDRWLAEPVFDEAVGSVVARLLLEAERLYVRAERGLALLPPDCRPGIRAARLLYAEIGNEVARRGFDSLASRAVVAPSRKLVLLARAFWPRSSQAGMAQRELLEEARFLLDATMMEPSLGPSGHDTLRWWDFRGRAIRTIDMFERLERRQRSKGSCPSSIGTQSTLALGGS